MVFFSYLGLFWDFCSLPVRCFAKPFWDQLCTFFFGSSCLPSILSLLVIETMYFEGLVIFLSRTIVIWPTGQHLNHEWLSISAGPQLSSARRLIDIGFSVLTQTYIRCDFGWHQVAIRGLPGLLIRICIYLWLNLVLGFYAIWVFWSRFFALLTALKKKAAVSSNKKTKHMIDGWEWWLYNMDGVWYNIASSRKQRMTVTSRQGE